MSGKYHNTHIEERVIKFAKRGRNVVVCKLVKCMPLNEVVVAVPYRHRRTVNVVSLPPTVVDYAIESGARRWVVRLDMAGDCYSFPLKEVPVVGWRKPSEGIMEYFVPLSKFQRIGWQDWDFVERSVIIGPSEIQTNPKQEARNSQQLAFAL